MKDLDSSLVHSSWLPVLEPHQAEITAIFQKIDATRIAPPKDLVLRAFSYPIESIRCLIVGQDPYPTLGHAHGLAFSTEEKIQPLPKSLKNIFLELHSDLGVEIPPHGNLERWAAGGVMLLNRVLTTEVGMANAHTKLGWQRITDAVAQELGRRDVVAILWGNHAQELAPYFTYRIESVHPSPLSAYRGFFGSRPFSRANELIAKQGREPIHW